MKIRSVDAYQVFDSRGDPTVEAVVELEDGAYGRALVPSGASTGSHEALELRDGDSRRFRGKSVYRAIKNIKGLIGPYLKGQDVFEQAQLDQRMIELDGTHNKSRLGANSILAVSMACCAAAASAREEPLFEYIGQGNGNVIPLPAVQIVGGGAHAARRIDVQDFMIVPVGASRYEQALEIVHNVYHTTGAILHERRQMVGVADEGGFWPVVTRNEDVFEIILTAVRQAGYSLGKEVALSLDIAATDLYHDGKYVLTSENRSFSSDQFAELLVGWAEQYPIISIEDPFAEDDWPAWRQFTQALGHRTQIVGDDLFTTSLTRIEQGISEQAANAVLIKPNQIGTVTETIQAVHRVHEVGWQPIISARSGETEDVFISHLAVALNVGQLKVGAFARSERTAKWNELLRIERRLGTRALFAGPGVFDKFARICPGSTNHGLTPRE